MFQASLVVDSNRARAMLGQFGKRSEAAMASAINDTLKNVNKAFKRDIKKQINISDKSLDIRIKIVKANKLTLSGQIVLLYEKRPGLFQFKGKQTAKGVTYALRVGGRRQLAPGTFIRTAKGNEHVFIRYVEKNPDPNKKRRKRRRPSGLSKERVPRYKLRRLLGVSPWGAYVGKGQRSAQARLARHTAEAQAALDKNLTKRIRDVLKGYVK